MALTTAQLPALKAAILAETDPAFVAYRTNGQTPLMTAFLNSDSAFVVFKSSVFSLAIGNALSYVALAAMTAANTDSLKTFMVLNPSSFDARRLDIRTFFANIFSGALGGEGQLTRDRMDALYRRNATRAEKLYATGTGTTASPGALVFEGSISDADINAALAE